MVLGYMADHRPHNPLVAGSSPGCPTFSTHTSKRVFTHYASNAKNSFYAIFTQSTTTDQRHSKQYLFFPISFSEIFSYFSIFLWEQREFWEHDSFLFYFQLLTDHLIVPIPSNRPWDQWEAKNSLYRQKPTKSYTKQSNLS
jgi:hypothetical protein